MLHLLYEFANVVHIAGHSFQHNNYGSQHVTLLTETQCAQELEKAQLLLQERDKEIEHLKKMIALLENANKLATE